MELHQLKYFCAVARTGSFTRGAEEEGVTQPTLSQQIRKLEHSLGVALFERRGRNVRLTQPGERLLPMAQEVLRHVVDARQALECLRGDIRGPLRVGCIPTVMPYLLAPRAAEFQSRYPDVELHLLEDTTARLAQQLQAGEVDVAIVGLPVPHRDLVCSELFREPLMLAVPMTHRLARAATVAPSELRRDRLLILREGHCFRGEALAACRRTPPRLGVFFETDQFASIFSLVAGGFGVSIVPEMASSHADGCRLIPLLRPAMRRIGYATARRPYVPPAERAFVAWLKGLHADSQRSARLQGAASSGAPVDRTG
jgi:LysR family hydrogen peroxide-inducible transcriptional activator